MNIKKSIFFVLILVFASFTFLFFNKSDDVSKKSTINNIQFVKIAGQTLKTELALTPDAQNRGLSGRIGLAEDESMLFIFDHPDRYSFWMKDMNFPIDIIWIDKDFKIVFIKKNVMPETYPEGFKPTKDALYVLEVVSGFSEKNNLSGGDSVLLLP